MHKSTMPDHIVFLSTERYTCERFWPPATIDTNHFFTASLPADYILTSSLSDDTTSKTEDDLFFLFPVHIYLYYVELYNVVEFEPRIRDCNLNPVGPREVSAGYLLP